MGGCTSSAIQLVQHQTMDLVGVYFTSGQQHARSVYRAARGVHVQGASAREAATTSSNLHTSYLKPPSTLQRSQGVETELLRCGCPCLQAAVVSRRRRGLHPPTHACGATSHCRSSYSSSSHWQPAGATRQLGAA